MKDKNYVSQVIGIFITILTPFVILMIAVRLLITPTFVQLAYRFPGFPDDPYGFTIADRLRWSSPSVKYLVNTKGITYLSSLQFDDGQPVFNERELSHMEDVKMVVTGMRIILGVAIGFLMLLTFILMKQNRRYSLLISYHWGGWAIIWLIASILFYVAINFDSLFTRFHQIFFEKGTWQFLTSDTLIRLFPMLFWQNAFIFVGVLSLAMGVLILVLSRTSKSVN